MRLTRPDSINCNHRPEVSGGKGGGREKYDEKGVHGEEMKKSEGGKTGGWQKREEGWGLEKKKRKDREGEEKEQKRERKVREGGRETEEKGREGGGGQRQMSKTESPTEREDRY